MPSQTLTVIQHPTDPSDGSGLVAITKSGKLVTIWSGRPPDITPGVHPSVARAMEQGGGDMGPCWIEERNGQPVLADLPLPMPISGAISVCIQLADGLAALHARGFCHGHIGLHAVTLSKSGTPMWIGTGRKRGSIDGDVSALQAMSDALHPSMPQSSHLTSAASLAAHWRESFQPDDTLHSWLSEHTPKTPDSRTPMSLDLFPLGLMDEVQPDLGDDRHGRGILDRWKTGEDGDELTDDPTVSVDIGAVHTQTRQHILNNLFQTLDSALGENATLQVPPSFKSEILSEHLDPTPALNGLEHGLIHNPGGVRERTGDISHPDITRPVAQNMDDTTGITGSTPIHQSVLTGLLMAAVVGMLGAAIMLTLVWLIIGDVF